MLDLPLGPCSRTGGRRVQEVVSGPWAGLGMSFYLVDATTHQPLVSAVIQQPDATLTATQSRIRCPTV